MHTFTIFSALLTSTVLAIPHARYGPDDNVFNSSTSLSTSFLPVTTSAPTLAPSSPLSPISNTTLPWSTIPQAIATSSPAPSPTSSPLTQAGVYICSDINWSGTCTHHFSNPTSAPADCVQLDGTASSIGPDEGFVCFFYTNSYCRPLLSDEIDFVTLEHPGENDMLQTYNGDLNDKIYSYFCLPGDGM